MIKAIIFDNDGVLVDSEIIYAKSNQKIISKFYKKANIEDILNLTVGMSEKESRLNLTQKYGVKFDCRFLLEKEKEVSFQMDNNLEACKGVYDLIKALKLKYALASNAYKHEIEFKLLKTGLNRYFPYESCYSGEEVLNPKPAPDVYLAAAIGINEKPENCMAVEDSVSGVRAGKAAGMYTVGCLGGSHIFDKESYKSKLINAGADVVINDIRELVDIIKKINR